MRTPGIIFLLLFWSTSSNVATAGDYEPQLVENGVSQGHFEFRQQKGIQASPSLVAQNPVPTTTATPGLRGRGEFLVGSEETRALSSLPFKLTSANLRSIVEPFVEDVNDFLVEAETLLDLTDPIMETFATFGNGVNALTRFDNVATLITTALTFLEQIPAPVGPVFTSVKELINQIKSGVAKVETKAKQIDNAVNEFEDPTKKVLNALRDAVAQLKGIPERLLDGIERGLANVLENNCVVDVFGAISPNVELDNLIALLMEVQPTMKSLKSKLKKVSDLIPALVVLSSPLATFSVGTTTLAGFLEPFEFLETFKNETIAIGWPSARTTDTMTPICPEKYEYATNFLCIRNFVKIIKKAPIKIPRTKMVLTQVKTGTKEVKVGEEQVSVGWETVQVGTKRVKKKVKKFFRGRRKLKLFKWVTKWVTVPVYEDREIFETRDVMETVDVFEDAWVEVEDGFDLECADDGYTLDSVLSLCLSPCPIGSSATSDKDGCVFSAYTTAKAFGEATADMAEDVANEVAQPTQGCSDPDYKEGPWACSKKCKDDEKLIDELYPPMCVGFVTKQTKVGKILDEISKLGDAAMKTIGDALEDAFKFVTDKLEALLGVDIPTPSELLPLPSVDLVPDVDGLSLGSWTSELTDWTEKVGQMNRFLGDGVFDFFDEKRDKLIDGMTNGLDIFADEFLSSDCLGSGQCLGELMGVGPVPDLIDLLDPLTGAFDSLPESFFGGFIDLFTAVVESVGCDRWKSTKLEVERQFANMFGNPVNDDMCAIDIEMCTKLGMNQTLVDEVLDKMKADASPFIAQLDSFINGFVEDNDGARRLGGSQDWLYPFPVPIPVPLYLAVSGNLKTIEGYANLFFGHWKEYNNDEERLVRGTSLKTSLPYAHIVLLLGKRDGKDIVRFELRFRYDLVVFNYEKQNLHQAVVNEALSLWDHAQQIQEEFKMECGCDNGKELSRPCKELLFACQNIPDKLLLGDMRASIALEVYPGPDENGECDEIQDLGEFLFDDEVLEGDEMDINLEDSGDLFIEYPVELKDEDVCPASDDDALDEDVDPDDYFMQLYNQIQPERRNRVLAEGGGCSFWENEAHDLIDDFYKSSQKVRESLDKARSKYLESRGHSAKLVLQHLKEDLKGVNDPLKRAFLSYMNWGGFNVAVFSDVVSEDYLYSRRDIYPFFGSSVTSWKMRRAGFDLWFDMMEPEKLLTAYLRFGVWSSHLDKLSSISKKFKKFKELAGCDDPLVPCGNRLEFSAYIGLNAILGYR